MCPCAGQGRCGSFILLIVAGRADAFGARVVMSAYLGRGHRMGICREGRPGVVERDQSFAVVRLLICVSSIEVVIGPC